MRIAILSDIHGNLEALNAVLVAAERLGADQIFSLGDIVGYGPDPGACVALVRRTATVSLLGNHDAAVTGVAPIDDFNDFARWAVEWTVSVLTPEDRAYLASLPYTFSGHGFLAVHASPLEPGSWHYVHGLADAPEHFERFRERICLWATPTAPSLSLCRRVEGCSLGEDGAPAGGAPVPGECRERRSAARQRPACRLRPV